MAALHLYTIIEGIHARVSQLPAEHKTDDALLLILFEQITVEYQRLTEEVDKDKRQMQAKFDKFTKREKARNISKRSHRFTVIRTLQQDKRNSKSRKSTRDSNHKTKCREFAEQQHFGEGKATLGLAELEQELREKAKKTQSEGEDAFLKSMKEARNEALRDQASAQKLEEDEVFLKSTREAKGEAIREQAKIVLSIKDQALRQQAYEVLEKFRRSMDDEEIARRYADGEEGEEEEGRMSGVPLPSARDLGGYEDVESKVIEATRNPWEELFQEIIDEATIVEEKEEKARRQIRERQSEVFEEEEKGKMSGVPLPSVRESGEYEDEESKAVKPTRDPWEELFQEIINEATIIEEKEKKAHREIQERLSGVFEALRTQFDDDELLHRWNEDEEEKQEMAFEGAENTGVPLLSDAEVEEQQKKKALRKQQEEDFKAFTQKFDDDEPARRWNETEEAEDGDIPLSSQPPTNQPSNSSSSASSTTSTRSRSTTASSTRSIYPHNTNPTIPAPASPTPKNPLSNKEQPSTQIKPTRYQPTPSIITNARSPRIAEEQIAKRRI
ncbi:ATP-dependent RNA helicase [Venturia nashicola]|uniref:ATP-dependent RNA helicase n=1 Tax=Venturia nashicola TaxID=86259 RepID=A0A4Z1PDM7_9PEZI|nr:ATP-dependent RNA helicase [Venturia nashicola]